MREIITHEMLLVREVARHVWNTCLGSQASDAGLLRAMECQESIERELIKGAILGPRNKAADARRYPSSPIGIQVEQKDTFRDSTEILLGVSEQNGNVVWEVFRHLGLEALPEFWFLSFYDWNPYEVQDGRFVKCVTGDLRIFLLEAGHSEFVFVSCSTLEGTERS